MPIHAKKNLYPGINPHLNSSLQQPGGGWRSFHAAHLADLYAYLDEHLPEGYTASLEQSLQFSIYNEDEPTAPILLDRTDADILISGRGRSQASGAVQADLPVLTLAFPEPIPDEDLPSAIVISDHTMRPVTRMELLSPANLPTGSHHPSYMKKRRETLDSGLRLVEIDYLHEGAPLLPGIPDYSRGDEQAFPYNILVSDPYAENGKIDVYAWSVADRLPVISLPLAGREVMPLAFTPLYNQTASRRNFRATVDYSELPVKFNTYSENDQAYIRQKMAQIAMDHNTE